LSTTVTLVLPPGEHQAASLPCVFVAPAGSSGVFGVPFGDGEHEDYYGLLNAGMAVCFYTLDGTVQDAQNSHDLLLSLKIQQYLQSRSGLNNLSDAIDTVLASAPAVDPQRLAASGHSSAGTIALMAAAYESRIQTSAVMAPVIDLEKRMEGAFDEGAPSIASYITESSPW